MLHYPLKRRAAKNAPYSTLPPRENQKTLKTKAISAPAPDPRLVEGGIPAISYLVALAVFAGLVLCAHINNSLPAPGDALSVPAGHAPSWNISAQALPTVLAASGTACTLAPGPQTISGSFSVLAHRPDGVVLSWAGARGAAPNTCPAATPLLVSQSAYQTLRN